MVTKKSVIYEQIKHAIISGEMKPGNILKEKELSEKFNIGKTPTREALIVLSHEKVLQPLPRLGYMVTQMSIRDILESFHVRTILEVEAIGLAIDHLAERDILELEENNQAEKRLSMIANLPERHIMAYQLNREFHMMIANLSGNMRLAGIINQLIYDMERMLAVDPHIADSSQHEELLKQLKLRNKEKAQVAIRSHLEETRINIMTRF